MLKANIEAQIESKYKEREEVRANIIKLDKLIDDFKKLQRISLDQETELCYEISELEEQLND